jgi:uncharacterized membrane protein YfcA
VLVLAGLFVVVLAEALRARSPAAIVLSAALAGLFAISLFDHYLWTLAPARLLIGMLLGAWAGQVNSDEHSGRPISAQLPPG